ncbi:MAG: Asp/Glu/hydantoin racemase [Planctomycetes bacterium]|nr:Asp/Glu/hydantoin racemase [Planctomycetota bacterium]
MKPHVFFLHSVSTLSGMFNELCGRFLPGVKITHVADEGLIQRALEAGGLTPAIVRRVCEHVTGSQDAGADVIQVTCSSLSPAVAVAGQLASVPVLTVDEPVARSMVGRYSRIGVIATACSTLNPSTELVRRLAAESGRKIAVRPVFCEGAYEAFFAGDMKKHDAIVLGKLRRLAAQVDAVLLAQVSMVRIANMLAPAERKKPILSSPEPAVRHLAKVVRRLAVTKGK